MFGNFFKKRPNYFEELKDLFLTEGLDITTAGYVRASKWLDNGAGVEFIYSAFLIQRIALDLVEYEVKNIDTVRFAARQIMHMSLVRRCSENWGEILDDSILADLAWARKHLCLDKNVESAKFFLPQTGNDKFLEWVDL